MEEREKRQDEDEDYLITTLDLLQLSDEHSFSISERKKKEKKLKANLNEKKKSTKKTKIGKKKVAKSRKKTFRRNSLILSENKENISPKNKSASPSSQSRRLFKKDLNVLRIPPQSKYDLRPRLKSKFQYQQKALDYKESSPFILIES
jgi:hypothetical protein